MGIKITAKQYQQMLSHVAQEDPLEACGLLGGLRDHAHVVVAIENISRSPVRFRMDPSEQISALFGFEERGLELVAIYHSHPSGPSGPSMTDIREAAYPEACELIWFREGGDWTCRAYRYHGDTAEQVPLEIESGEEQRGADNQH